MTRKRIFLFVVSLLSLFRAIPRRYYLKDTIFKDKRIFKKLWEAMRNYFFISHMQLQKIPKFEKLNISKTENYQG